MLSLVNMSDAFFGRIFLVLGVMLPFGTMSLTTYLHVSADELLQDPADGGVEVLRGGLGRERIAGEAGDDDGCSE